MLQAVQEEKTYNLTHVGGLCGSWSAKRWEGKSTSGCELWKSSRVVEKSVGRGDC